MTSKKFNKAAIPNVSIYGNNAGTSMWIQEWTISKEIKFTIDMCCRILVIAHIVYRDGIYVVGKPGLHQVVFDKLFVDVDKLHGISEWTLNLM